MQYTDPDPLLKGSISFESLEEEKVLIDDIVILGLGNDIQDEESHRI